ncbi:MAG: galactokinase [bacterium]|nr:galactokinase [bacterium]
MTQKIAKIFKQKFQKDPLLFRAPGRINLIGEHTDYNEGFVLPAAVSQSIYFAIAPNNSSQVNVYSVDFDELFQFDLSDLDSLKTESWKSYVFGVIAEISKMGEEVSGLDMVFQGDVPQGAGMSSSAALECGTCTALNELFELDLEPVEIAQISQKAEHNYAGVMCGIMDQFASVMGKQKHALLLDCRSLEYKLFPLEIDGYKFLLLNSKVSHNLVDSEYNVRKKQCEEGVRLIQEKYPEVNSLRDVNMTILSEASDLDEVVLRRCKYVIEENDRVQEFASAISCGELEKAGEILKRAQLGMATEYEITCPEIDFMADFANNHHAILGARMMGGGFGGCTINLIKAGEEQAFIQEISEAYKKEYSLDITPIEIEIANGAERIVL